MEHPVEEEKRRLFESLLDTCGEPFGHLLDTSGEPRSMLLPTCFKTPPLLLKSASAEGW